MRRPRNRHVSTTYHQMTRMFVCLALPQKKLHRLLFLVIYFFVTAYYGILFPGREEAAFANFRLWESMGYIIAYIISPYMRTSEKTYLILVTLIVGVLCYFIVEYRDRKSKKFAVQKTNNNPEKGFDNIAFQNVE